MLIVIEGLDGAGKSTQVKKLKEYLEEKTRNLNYIHFPRYDAPVYGGLISDFLKGKFGAIDEVHPQLVALLFAEDRHEAASGILRSLTSGATVLLDRYVYSNIAYQCAKLKTDVERESLREWIFDTEYRIFGIPKPDLNIYLDVPISFVEHSLTSSRTGQDRNYLEGARDIHESDIEFQKNVKAMYLRCAELDPSLTVVSCSDTGGGMLPPEEIFQKIVDVYENRL